MTIVSILKNSRFLCIMFAALMLASFNSFAQRVYFDPHRFDEELQVFDTKNAATPEPEKAVLFVGSSSVRLWSSIKEDLAPLTIVHRGFGGSNMKDAVHHIDRLVIAYKPRAVVLYEGDNDLSAFTVTPNVVMQNFNLFVENLRAALPKTRLYILSIKPSIARMQYWGKMTATNDMLQKRCSEISECRYIDVATPMFTADGKLNESIFVSDGIHMNSDGYKIWKDAIKPVLQKFELQEEAN